MVLLRLAAIALFACGPVVELAEPEAPEEPGPWACLAAEKRAESASALMPYVGEEQGTDEHAAMRRNEVALRFVELVEVYFEDPRPVDCDARPFPTAEARQALEALAAPTSKVSSGIRSRAASALERLEQP